MSSISLVLDVSGLHLSLANGGPELVHNVSFQVRAGEMFGIVGESGSGKTMTLRALSRLFGLGLEVDVGRTVMHHGRDLLSLSESELLPLRGSEIGFVFQEPLTALNPGFNLRWHFKEALRGSGRRLRSKRSTELAMAALDDVGMPHPAHVLASFPHELSGGMRQRAVLALAMVNEPTLLLADEPTTALDVTLSADILDLLEKLQADRNLAIVFVSHDLNLVASRCQRVAIMHGGRVVEMGPADRVLSAPRHPYSMALLESSVDPFDHPRAVYTSQIDGHDLDLALSESTPEIAVTGLGCRYAAKCPYVGDGCLLEEPELLTVERGHLVACFRTSEIHAEPR